MMSAVAGVRNPIALIVGCLAIAGLPRDAWPAGEEWNFRVYLDEKPIGYHEFDVEHRGDTVVVRTEAEFDVRILFLTAFSYRHENVETWRDDCLLTIDASTDNNGQALRVEGRESDDRFDLVATNESRSLPGCVQTFAYWNPAILEASRLLNSQTGEYEAVSAEFEAKDQLRINGVPTPADRYTLMTKGGKISLWYSEGDRRWLALEAPAKGGRRLRYEPVVVPPPATWPRMARTTD